MSRVQALALIVVACTGCGGTAPTAQGAPARDNSHSRIPMTQSIDISTHFSGPELALARAAASGDAAEVRRLVLEEHADPDAVSPGGLPLIAWPILQANAEGVDALLANGAHVGHAAPGAGVTIAWAAKAKDPHILQAFLDHGGDANARNADDEPLTRVAALAGRWDNVKLLLEHGADIDATAHGQAGDTLLGYYSAGQFDKAQWLLEHDADASSKIVHAASPDRVGAQPIVENIYWWPIQAARFPALAQAQQRCQDLLAARGLGAPAQPAHLARLRASQGGSGDTPAPQDLNQEIERREADIDRQLKPR